MKELCENLVVGILIKRASENFDLETAFSNVSVDKQINTLSKMVTNIAVNFWKAFDETDSAWMNEGIKKYC